jgi:hypothetical protein
MGEIVCMENLIKGIDNSVLVIDDKEYIKEYCDFVYPAKLRLTISDLQETDLCFICCIVPAGCMRLPEIKEVVRLKILIRIGQFYKDKTKYKFCFNYPIEIDNFTNQIDTSNELLEMYENFFGSK